MPAASRLWLSFLLVFVALTARPQEALAANQGAITSVVPFHAAFVHGLSVLIAEDRRVETVVELLLEGLAGLLLAAISHFDRLEIPSPCASEVIAATGAGRSQAYALRAQVEALLAGSSMTGMPDQPA